MARVPLANDDLEVEIWLPGSRISLHGEFFIYDLAVALIEGNIKEAVRVPHYTITLSGRMALLCAATCLAAGLVFGVVI